jgi:hypothetical protein
MASGLALICPVSDNYCTFCKYFHLSTGEGGGAGCTSHVVDGLPRKMVAAPLCYDDVNTAQCPVMSWVH